MKKYRLSFVLMVLLISITLLGVFSIKGVSAETIDYTFENNILYENSSISYDNIFNVRNQTIVNLVNFSDTTYSFTDDDDAGHPVDWVVSEGDSTSIEVVSEKEGRTKVVEINDWGGYTCSMYNIIDAKAYGSVSFWWLFSGTSANRKQDFELSSGGIGNPDNIIQLYCDTNDLYINGGILIKSNLPTNVWFFIRIDFESTANGYMGLAENYFRIGVNGENHTDTAFWYNKDTIDRIVFETWGASCMVDEPLYVDAIGYSWDENYEMGDESIISIDYTNITEVNKDEFNFHYNGTQYNKGIVNEGDFINGWECHDSQSDVSIIQSSELYDNEIKIYSDTVHARWFEKSLDFTTDGIINYTIALSYLDMNNDGSSIMFGFFNTSVREIAAIRFYYTGGNILLQHMDQDRSGSWSTDYTVDDSDYLYRTISIIVNENDIVYVRYKDNSSVDYFYTFNKIDNAPTYYYNVVFFSSMNDPSGTQGLNVDSVSISVNGTTTNYVNDYILYIPNLTIPKWYSLRNSLVKFNASGIFSFCIFDVGGNSTSPRGFYNYTGFKVWNIANFDFEYINSSFVFISNTPIIINYISISGVKLVKGFNVYWLYFASNNVNIDESYFYVDSNNRLQYILIADDNNVEYIQAIFYITDIPAENRSVSFRSNINGNAYGYFSIKYYDSKYSVIPIPYYSKTTQVILPQTKMVDSFSILITDNDLTDNTICTGYISNIQLIYNPDLHITITTLTLLAIIVPLMIMIIPPICLHKKFGTTGVFIMFLLMAIVCVATSLIPIWLFFIIALSSIGLLAMKKEIGDKI